MAGNIARNSALVGGGVAIGVGVGYLVAVKTLEKKYAALADEDIRSVKEAYQAKAEAEAAAEVTTSIIELIQAEEYVSPLPDIVEEEDYIRPERKVIREEKPTLEQAISKYTRASVHPGTPPLEEDTGEDEDGEDKTEDSDEDEIRLKPHNIFEADKIQKAARARPVLITVDEFYAAELDYEQQELTYYVGGNDDETLTDSREQPIADIDQVVGIDNLERFGESDPKSKDTLYVRNAWLEVDFEVTRSHQSYLEAVLGVPESMTELPRVMKKSRNVRDD